MINLEKESYTKGEIQELIKALESQQPNPKTEKEIEIEQRYNELAKREKEVNCKEYGIPSEVAEFLTDTADFKKIGEYLKQNQGGYIPQNHKQMETITKDEFNKLSYSERAKLYEQNPELIKTII